MNHILATIQRHSSFFFYAIEGRKRESKEETNVSPIDRSGKEEPETLRQLARLGLSDLQQHLNNSHCNSNSNTLFALKFGMRQAIGNI